jgi:hypothetical protein
VELEGSVSGEGKQFVQQFVTVPGLGGPFPVGAEVSTSIRSFAGTVTWQFFDNEWVHPFVSAGVSADVEHRSLQVWEQYYYAGDPRLPGGPILVAPEKRKEPTTTAVRALLGGGVKLYVLERAFIRADGRVSVDGKRQNVAFRAGIGVDF